MGGGLASPKPLVVNVGVKSGGGPGASEGVPKIVLMYYQTIFSVVLNRDVNGIIRTYGSGVGLPPAGNSAGCENGPEAVGGVEVEGRVPWALLLLEES